MSVLLDGIFQHKSQNKLVRRNLYREAQRGGSEKLYERLRQVDPAAAARIHPHDTKRIIRALEVFECTGKQISELQKQRKGLADAYDVRIFCLDMQRDRLYDRIEARVEGMLRRGLLREVKKLLARRLSETAYCAIGIKELKGYFDGLYDLTEARRLIKRNSRLYAKRQLTWFRKDKRIDWIKVGQQEKPQAIAKRIVKNLNGKSTSCNRKIEAR
jgi:tRNA dimethylallyltransferase